MEFESISAAARFGMAYERQSLEIASQRLAIANVAYSSAAEANKASAGINESFKAVLMQAGVDVNTMTFSSGVREVHDPSNPVANSDGNVFFADVDHVSEMARMVTAIRAYEANVRAYNTNSEMNAAALAIGDRN